MKEDEKSFPPEAVGEQIEQSPENVSDEDVRLIHDLQQTYQLLSVKNAGSIERVWGRIVERRENMQDEGAELVISDVASPAAYPLPIQPSRRKRGVASFLQMLAAVLVIGALLASFVVLFASHHPEVESTPGLPAGVKPLGSSMTPEPGTDGKPTEPVYAAIVEFSTPVTYAQALKIVTDLGLQTFADCTVTWKPEGDRQLFQDDHLFTVASTVSGVALWVDRLKAVPGIVRVDNASGPHSCPLIPVSRDPAHLLPEHAGTYVRVTFSNAVQSYDTALAAMNDLGFRLANPCYEQARARGTKPAWSMMGQEDAFGKTHTLLLATTFYNSVQWKKQLATVTGVVNIEEPVRVTC